MRMIEAWALLCFLSFQISTTAGNATDCFPNWLFFLTFFFLPSSFGLGWGGFFFFSFTFSRGVEVR